MTIELLIEQKMPLAAAGQMQLPKQPPFGVLTPGPAAVVTLQLEPESPRSIKLFDLWYFKEAALDVVAHDGKGVWIRAAMLCVGMERHAGIQATRPWSEPMRRAMTARGQSLFYRPSPRHQAIARNVHIYTLAAQRYEFVAPLPNLRRSHDREQHRLQ